MPLELGIANTPQLDTFESHNAKDSSLRLEGIEHIKALVREDDIKWKLNQREAFWIHQLVTLKYSGLNEDIDYTRFLSFFSV